MLGLAWSDGVAVPYRWVHPPAHLKAANVAPSGVRAAHASGSVATPDGQAIVTLPQGVSGAVEIEPLDPASLGHLPGGGGLIADGNAYRVDVPRLDTDGSITLVAPIPPKALLYSADGRSWQALEGARPVGDTGYGGPLRRSGHYLLGAAPGVPVQGVDDDRTRPLVVIGAAVALGLAGFAALLWPLLRSRGGGRV